ncbi:glycosidase [Sinomonas sp. ASV486]|uniref:Glycosidase n=1 Tax=Sinomonas puerhi TaxID=3238584 RepID=A0AB39L5D4_9MICC|nr:glycosidase [Sinomonas sp. ASV486]MDQ4491917.1 glycosidase [Sinomonas sp. ASV486]
MPRNANAAGKLELRLKAVLDGLAEAAWADEQVDARAVLTAAVDAVPFDEAEAFLLAGGIPRGHKALTAATAKLVKAGWMVKGRTGWAITEDGLRATVAFPTAEALAEALASGTPVPADTPVPAAPPAKKKPARKAPAKKAAAVKETVAAPQPEQLAAPIEATASEIPAPAAAQAPADETDVPDVPGAVDLDQPEAVAIAGDFGTHLGADADWEPQPDAVQMGLDAQVRRWVRTVDLPAGHYTFKIAINRSWDENYGAFGTFNGANHELAHDGGSVTIEYDHATKDVAFS